MFSCSLFFQIFRLNHLLFLVLPIIFRIIMEYLWTVKIYYTCFSFMILSIPSRIYLSTTSSRKKSSRSQSDRVCPPSIRLPKFSQKVKLISRRRYMYRTCLIQLATDIPTSKLSNYNTRGERERKSRLRLAFCPGSLPAIRRVNALAA